MERLSSDDDVRSGRVRFDLVILLTVLCLEGARETAERLVSLLVLRFVGFTELQKTVGNWISRTLTITVYGAAGIPPCGSIIHCLSTRDITGPSLVVCITKDTDDFSWSLYKCDKGGS